MVEIDFSEGEPAPLIDGAWQRVGVFMWGRVECWRHVPSDRAAFVEAGPDSLARAQALLAAHPTSRAVVDETAARWRRMSRELVDGDDAVG